MQRAVSGTPGRKRTPWLLPRMSIARLPPPSPTARLACVSLNGSLSHLVGKAQASPWEDQVCSQPFSMGPRGGRSSRLQAGRRPLGAELAPHPHGQGWLLLGSLCLSSAGCTDDASSLLYKLLCTDRAVWLC